jgi:UDP-N-acetylmuramyl pentapeptide synthase
MVELRFQKFPICQVHRFGGLCKNPHHAQMEAAKQAVIAFLNEKVQSNDLLILKGSNPLGLQTILEKF